MIDFLCNLNLLPLVLTIGTYQVGLSLRKKWKHPLCNPLIISIFLIIPVLLITKFPIEKYQSGVEILSFFLTPCTVCFAIPLYQQLKILKKNVVAILVGIGAGTITALSSIAVLCGLFALDNQLTVSLLPKSITTAIGLVLSQQNGGIEGLTAIAIFITGISGSLCGSSLCKLLGLRNPIAQGVAMGTASHIMGTSKAAEMSDLAGAVSSTSLTISGILTAVLFPLVLKLL